MNHLYGTNANGVPEHPKVLLVDDDDVNLLLVSAALSQHGFEVTEATGGDSALRMLRHWTPDLVVLDARMPGLDGFETCRQLREMYGFENVPVLMLTGLDDETSVNRAYQAGATDFFVKSNQWSLLAGRLRYMLRAARTHQELVRSKAKLARAQDLARMGSFDWWYDQTQAYSLDRGLELSEEGLRVFGCGPDEHLTLRALLHMVPPVDRRGLLRQTRMLLRQVTVINTDVPMNLPDGRFRIIHVEAEAEFGEYGQCNGYTGIVQDVTDRRQAEDSIRRLANNDSLTSLPNRRQLMWRTERALEQSRRMNHQVALLMIDLDRFKNINDTLGHAAGDELLIEVALRLRSCVRHSDQIFDGLVESVGGRSHRALEAVGRLGGDEFVALLPEVHDERDAERVAQRVLEALRVPIYVAGQECFATASVGIALFPRDGTNVHDLMRNADVAMYAAKSSGRNGMMLYTPQLAGRGREKLELETALHKAIERNELVLYYQPKVDVATAKMVGVEALMRWKRGDQLVPPGDFIPLAEETGLIVPLSEWALREAARQARVWKDDFGFNESIAVNMPNRMFLRNDLVELVRAAVEPHDIPHRMILLEITEDSLMKDLQSILPTLQRLNEIGVQISVDDFGTGYSSLSRLTTLPITEVKIDRSFVNDLVVTRKGTAVIRTIVALARALGLRVIAEGVESLSQQEVLHRQGCSIMQGFMFSRPIPGDQIGDWVRRMSIAPKGPWIASVEVGMDDADERAQITSAGA
ncbi:putative bifunctional diguanylate cyclase/phosphodiesterase [Ideonella paludis]|uniref:EAL domain-containing protein n=1 Tax=Ideonella paludis TaxID=1233411 RepID=A0ABS5E1R1_9BURK|nr:EAL domain-containing protein [Ideonella paludis]MBQ0937234.1 EAL domain-containing protein [Ideonella paludis]